MDMNTETTSYETRRVPQEGRPQAFREMAEKGTTQAKESYEKMNAATTEAADLIKNSYSTAVKSLQDYNNKIIEFAHANTNAAFDFVQKLSGVKSPSTFLEFSTKHARKQLETLTEQTKLCDFGAQERRGYWVYPRSWCSRASYGEFRIGRSKKCGPYLFGFVPVFGIDFTLGNWFSATCWRMNSRSTWAAGRSC
jgi:phasin